MGHAQVDPPNDIRPTPDSNELPLSLIEKRYDQHYPKSHPPMLLVCINTCRLRLRKLLWSVVFQIKRLQTLFWFEPLVLLCGCVFAHEFAL